MNNRYMLHTVMCAVGKNVNDVDVELVDLWNCATLIGGRWIVINHWFNVGDSVN